MLEVLAQYPLDPTFEEYGNFATLFTPYRGWNEENEKYKGCTSFFGNFLAYSNVFRIITDEQEIIDKLTAGIRTNQQTVEYKTAKVEYLTDKRIKEIARKKFENNEFEKTFALREMYAFPHSAEGIEMATQIKNELLQSI